MTQIYYWNNTEQIEETIDAIRIKYPNVSIPENADLSIIGYSKVEGTDVPIYNRDTHGIRAGIDPVLIKRTWEVYPLPQEEIDLILETKVRQLKESIVTRVQERLDYFARTNGYDGILSACTYADSVVPKFAAEGTRAKELRDTTWAATYQIMQDVLEGIRPTPTSFEDIESELPALTWE